MTPRFTRHETIAGPAGPLEIVLNLPEGTHTIRLKWINPDKGYEYRINDMIVYSENEPKSNLPVSDKKQ